MQYLIHYQPMKVNELSLFYTTFSFQLGVFGKLENWFKIVKFKLVMQVSM